MEQSSVTASNFSVVYLRAACPNFFTSYTNDAPPRVRDGNVKIACADDITQIIQYQGTSKMMAQRATVRKSESQNKYESSWHLKTNTTKFSILRLGAGVQDQLVINQDAYNTKHQGRILELKPKSHSARCLPE